MDQDLSHNLGTKPPAPVYVAATVVIFFLTLSAADSVGFVPYYIDGTEPATTSVPVVQDYAPITDVSLPEPELSLTSLPELGDPLATATKLKPQVVAEVPKPVTAVRISIDSIGLDLPLLNTQSRNLATLDKALEKGPVRYMDSAELNVPGNMLIFAHSSHLPIVHNKMYQAFNKLPELTEGDVISLYGEDGKQYLYSVTSVRKASATDAVIDLSAKQGTRLTLVTCDTLTSKASRFIVEADFIGTAQ